MEGRREDVETSPHFSSVVSPPREVDGCLVYATAPKWTVRSHKFPGIDLNLAFLHIMFTVSLNRFLWPPRVLAPCVSLCKKYLSWETVFRHSHTMASPAEMVLHYHCLSNSCAGLREETGIDAAIFPSDTKYLSETTLVEYLHGLQKTSIINPRLARVEYCGKTNCFVDHHFSIFPKAMVIEHSISQFPEGCGGTAPTV